MAERNPKRAAAALSLAFELAQRDYFLVARRAIVGATLWDYLSPHVRDELLDDARLLMTDKPLRFHLIMLLNSPSGTKLVSRVLTHDAKALHNR